MFPLLGVACLTFCALLKMYSLVITGPPLGSFTVEAGTLARLRQLHEVLRLGFLHTADFDFNYMRVELRRQDSQRDYSVLPFARLYD